MKILCVGSTAIDITLPVDGFIKENKKIKINKQIVSGGGFAYNVSSLLARWGNDTYIAAATGNDYYGHFIKEELIKEGVNTKYLYQDGNISTPSAYIISNKENASRTIVGVRDDNLKYKDIEKLDTNFDYLLLDGYDYELALDAISQNEEAKILVNADYVSENVIKLCRVADYVVASIDFAEEYTGKKIDLHDYKTLIEVYNDLKDAFKKAHLIITLGESGSFTYEDGYKLIPSIKIDNIKDSTGAGDIYVASFLYFIAQGDDLLIAMRKASIAGAISLEGLGVKNSLPSIEEVIKRFDENK